MHIDALDRAIGGVIVQEGHPIAFESRKLNYAEQKYSIHEKEMTIVVHCFGIWRVYLLGQKFIVKMDNIVFLGHKRNCRNGRLGVKIFFPNMTLYGSTNWGIIIKYGCT